MADVGAGGSPVLAQVQVRLIRPRRRVRKGRKLERPQARRRFFSTPYARRLRLNDATLLRLFVLRARPYFRMGVFFVPRNFDETG